MRISSRSAASTLLVVTSLGAGATLTATPAQAAADPYPNAPVCVVKSDHMTVKKSMPVGLNTNSVKEAQCWLVKRGFPVTVDGKFGASTETAVKNFQSRNGLKADGVVGPTTWGKLINGSGSTPAPSDRQAKVDKVLSYARAQLGKPYVLGAEGPRAFDCSGLTLRSYQQIGINLPRKSDRQPDGRRQVTRAQAQPGDLVYWPGHVAIYKGNGRVYSASSSQKKVIDTSLWGSPKFYRVF